MRLKHNIKHLRQSRGLSQEQLAEQIGKTKSNLSSYENGRSVPPLEVLLQLCEVFQVNLDDLVNKDLSRETPELPKEAPRRRFDPDMEEEELFRRLLVLKLEEVSNRLKETQPELYKELRLGELVKREKDFE